jgi:hypothetical protein
LLVVAAVVQTLQLQRITLVVVVVRVVSLQLQDFQ